MKAANPYETSTRADIGMGTATPVGFHAVRRWLYKAGFVSLLWLANVGFSLGPNKCNQVLGLGTVIDPKIESIPRGYLFNFHADLVVRLFAGRRALAALSRLSPTTASATPEP